MTYQAFLLKLSQDGNHEPAEGSMEAPNAEHAAQVDNIE
jgi:hypothetical protein